MENYYGRTLPDIKSLGIRYCYICGKKLGSKTNKDHIIPQKMFAADSPHRPWLPVHPACNNKKSPKDERFALRVAISSHLISKEATNDLAGFFEKVGAERDKAYVIGQSKNIRNYKLSKTLGKGMSQILQVDSGENPMVEVRMSDDHVNDQNEYAASLAKGLYARNIAGKQPDLYDMRWLDFMVLTSQGKFDSTMGGIEKLRSSALENPTGFGQLWPRRVSYTGCTFSPGSEFAGFVYLEFYNALGIFCTFK